MSRYSLRRVSPSRIQVLDSEHGNLETASVILRTTVDGTGWMLYPNNVGRKTSRKLHATPEQAIASMKYMTRNEAAQALVNASGADISNHGGHDIHHPRVPLTVAQRAFEMWAVHPRDLDVLGFETRQAYFEAHLQAAIEQAKTTETED